MPVHVTRRWVNPAVLAIIFTFTHFGCYWNKAGLQAYASNHSNRFVEALPISVCIPAIPRDVESGCLDELISSIKRQTVSADEVIISLSNATYPEASRIREHAQETIAPVPVKVVRATEIYVQGKSRNNAVLASTAELISFIDADDKMHPHRLEVIREAFRKNKDLQVFLHGYIDESFEMPNDGDEYQWESKSMLTGLSKHVLIGKEEICESEVRSRSQPHSQPHLDLPVHHAHVTVKRSVFEKYIYDESPEAYRVEDSLFVRNVVAAACSQRNVSDLLFLKLPLSLYRGKRATCSQRDNR
jgi:glycosyltransferase involved in cell wall biosynthesis